MDEESTGSADGGDDGIAGGASANSDAADTGSLPIASPSGAEPPKRGRGRPRGSTGKRSADTSAPAKAPKVQAALNSNFLESAIFAIHIGIANIASKPEFALSEGDSKKLAEALKKVNAHYDIPVLSPKAQAWGELAMVAGGIYGPMLVMAMQSRKAKSAPTPAAQAVQTKAQDLGAATVATFSDPSLVLSGAKE